MFSMSYTNKIKLDLNVRGTYSLILDLFLLAAFESKTMPLVLEASRGDEPLNLRAFGIGFLAFTLRLYLTTNDILADLYHIRSTCHS